MEARSRNAVVALKQGGGSSDVGPRDGKQERRGGIETRINPLIPQNRPRGSRNAVVALKHADRCAGCVGPAERSRNAVVALKPPGGRAPSRADIPKQERRGGIETFGLLCLHILF